MRKPYTMGELKRIVDYLVEHRLYGEIRGRKMWVDLANTHKLDRSWQSLKEAFLKRILPDIHNPYYKLSVNEIASFRGGCDVTEKHSNKLEIHTVTDSSNSNGNHLRDNQQPCTSKAIPEYKTSGEETKSAKISSRNRSSTDTLVLENCGEADEEAQEEPTKSSKSFRDLITYSEPLTPMLQEVLHDFDSDEDPQMQIVEDDVVVPEKPKSPSPFEIRQSRSMRNDPKKSPTKLSADNKSREGNPSPRSQPGKIKSLKLKKTRKGTWENKIRDDSPKGDEDHKSNSQKISKTTMTTTDHVAPIIISTKGNACTTEKSKPSINCSNISTDTPIPNNQEALSKPEQPANQDDKVAAMNGDLKRSISPQNSPQRKRSKGNSVDTNTSSDVKIINDAEGSVVSITDTPLQHDSSKENIPNSDNIQQNDKSNDNQNSANDNIEANNIITISEENNIETGEQKKPDPSEKVNMINGTSADKNPCLNSVSLFHEQFSTVRYSGSESEDDAIKSKAKNVEQNLKSHDATIVHKETTEKANNDETRKSTPEKGILKKNAEVPEVITISESQNEKPGDVVPTDNPATEIVTVTGFRNSTDSDFEKPKQKHVSEGRIYQKPQREKALANVFGFTIGGVRKRTQHLRKSSHNGGRRYSSRSMEESSSSGHCTTSNDDSASPPQHRNHHRKYSKPKPYRILSQMDGALFAVEGNRVYPVVRQDNKRMHFAELMEIEEEHAESYWKKKYEEEKVRADELARLLAENRPTVSPILQTKALISTKEQDKQKITKDMTKDRALRISDASETKTEPKQDNAVKIKFKKDNEIELECQFPHVDPLLDKMAKIFQVNIRQKEPAAAAAAAEQAIVVESRSGTATPLALAPRDPEVIEKIKEKESEIFRQIEVLDKMEQDAAAAAPADGNVTKRKRGRPRKYSVLSMTSPKEIPQEILPKKARAASVDKIHEKVKKAAVLKSPAKSDTASVTSSTKRRSARMVKEDATADKQNKVTNASLSRKSRRTNSVDIPLDDSQVRYKFPKEPRSTSRTRVPNKRNADYISNYAKGDSKTWSPPVTCNMNSIESSLGYQNSDASLESAALRRRRRYPSSHFYRKSQGRIKLRRKSHPYLADDDTCESIPSVPGGAQSTTLKSEIYRSESYQQLDVKKQSDFVSANSTNNSSNQNVVSNIHTLTVSDDNVVTLRVNRSQSSRTEEGNSSNVSLPLSLELSVVENVTATKEVLESFEDEQPKLNENFAINEQNSDCNEYMMSEIDISLPLMGQDCELHKERQTLIDKPDSETGIISESLLGKICTVNLKEQSSSDTLAVKLGNLLLDSAKKIVQRIQRDDDPNKENAMEVDTTVKKVKKTRISKKRCSTPRKRLSKNKAASVGPVLEEHSESCAYNSARKSCPPAIKIFPCDDVCRFDEQDNNNTVLDAVNTNRRGRKKKDIIKVKITRPKKDKSSLSKKDKSYLSEETQHSSRKSCYSDSGINDESYFLQRCDDDSSIELIHNHSETCLQTNECMGDSVEFIQNSKSIISVNSDSMTCDNSYNDIEDKELPELFCDNAQDAGHLNMGHELIGRGSNDSTVYFTPLSHETPNSLITEDLSDEIAPESRPVRPGKWYICREEETTTFPEEESPSAGIGSNLNQIFTVVCTVPNLSTITEASRENDSRKPTLDTEDE